MAERRLRIGSEFVHVANVPTPALFLVQPGAGQGVHSERWRFDPSMAWHDYTDVHGNRIRRTVLPAGESLVGYYALADVPDVLDEADDSALQLPPEELPDDVLLYTLPSRYCQSDVLGQQAWERFGGLSPDYRRAQAISDFVWNHLEYRTGSTGSWWSAHDSYTSGYGVCRDFAHLMVSFCRALNLPARYVSGLLPDLDVAPLPEPMDFHAWVEVYLGDRWYTFDPRHNERRKGRLVIAHGRDAADVALVTTFGAPWLKRLTVWCDEVGDDQPEWPPQAAAQAGSPSRSAQSSS